MYTIDNLILPKKALETPPKKNKSASEIPQFRAVPYFILPCYKISEIETPPPS